jgi:hypothetical protein
MNEKPSNLSFITTSELIDELKNRYDGLVFAGVKSTDSLDPAQFTYNVVHHGHLFSKITLIELLKHKVFIEEKDIIRLTEQDHDK